MNSAFNADNDRRIRKALHAFKRDPSDYNANRVAQVVNGSGCVYVENKLRDFVQQMSRHPQYAGSRYEGYVTNFGQLLDE